MSGRVRGPGRARTTEGDTATWWYAVDIGVLGAMVVLGSVLLIPAYGSPQPVAAAAVGAVLAAAVLLLLQRLQWPGWIAVPGIAVVVVVVGSMIVAPAERTAGILPSVAGVQVVLRGMLGSWRDLLTVATPTGVAGALLVPPLVIGALATGIAGWLAVTSRPSLALLSPAAALLVFALFGSLEVGPWWVAVVAGLFLATGMSWVAWVASRVRRRAAARLGTASVTGSAGAAAITRRALAIRRITIATVVLVVAAVVGGLTAAAQTPERTALRDLVEAPVDPAAFVSPLSNFRSYTKDQADVVQLSATGLPAGARLRLAALDAYDGRQFALTNDEGPFVRIGPQRDGTEPGDPAEVTVVVQGYSGSFLPLPGPVVALDFGGPRSAQLTNDLRYSELAATGVMPGGFTAGDAYTVTAAVPPQPGPDQLATARPLGVPFPSTVALPDQLRSAAGRYTAGVTGAAAQVEAIAAGLAADGMFSHGTAGELRSPAGHGLDRLAAMVTGTSMVGDQEQYAALMTLLVRSIGLPARVAVGFVPPAGTPAGAEVALRGRDISAWVEVPFDEYGWVAFDPSPSPDKPVTDTQERAPTERRAVTVEVPPALPQAQPDSVDAENAAQRPDSAQPDPQTAAGNESVIWLVLQIIGWLLLALAVLAIPVVVIMLFKRARRRRRRRAQTPREQVTGGWEELMDTAVDAGYLRHSWDTRTETAADLQRTGLLQVDWLAPTADAAEFAPDQIAPDRANAFWREVDDRSAELLGGLPLWRRWRARLSLASMRRADRWEQQGE